jgi:hypothetical protein
MVRDCTSSRSVNSQTGGGNGGFSGSCGRGW